MTCLHCQSTDVIPLAEVMTIEYKGKDLEIIMEYTVCANCSREFVTKDQIITNDAHAQLAKESI